MPRPRRRNASAAPEWLRYLAAREPRDDFYAAFWNLAVYQTNADRRQARLPRRSAWKLPIAVTASLAAILRRYGAHCREYLRREPHFQHRRSLIRQINALLERSEIKVGTRSRRRNRRGRVSGGLINTWTFTRRGKQRAIRLAAAVQWRAML